MTRRETRREACRQVLLKFSAKQSRPKIGLVCPPGVSGGLSSDRVEWPLRCDRQVNVPMTLCTVSRYGVAIALGGINELIKSSTAVEFYVEQVSLGDRFHSLRSKSQRGQTSLNRLTSFVYVMFKLSHYVASKDRVVSSQVSASCWRLRPKKSNYPTSRARLDLGLGPGLYHDDPLSSDAGRHWHKSDLCDGPCSHKAISVRGSYHILPLLLLFLLLFLLSKTRGLLSDTWTIA
jgi:hypothetical protein